jgi:PAS domain S-box-containing protein
MAWRSIPEAPVDTQRRARVDKPIFRAGVCIAAVVTVTAALYAVPLDRRPLTSALSFLFVVLIVSATWGFRYSLFASLLGALGFSWLLPPVGRFWLSDPRDILVLAALLVIGITTSRLSDRARREALNANQRLLEVTQAQQARQEMEEQWRAAFENNPTMYFIVDAAGAIASVNTFGAEQLGYTANELVGQPVLKVFHEPDRQAVQGHAKACFEQPGRMMRWEARKIRKDGTMLWVRETGNAVLLRNRPVLLVVCEDITERKRAEEELRAAETRFRTSVDHLTDAVFIHDDQDDQGRIIDVNQQACDSLGYTREELIGRTAFDYDPSVDAAFNLSIKERLARGESLSFETVHRRKDGTTFPVELRARPFWHGDHRFGLALARDITDRKRAERERERLRQLEADLAHINRVSMMGELAASLAHEIKQPIAAAATNAGTCLRWLQRQPPEIEEARETATRISQDVNRAAEIINRVRSLYTKEGQQRELVRVNEVIEEMIVLLRNEASRYSILIRSDLAKDLPKVMADRVQLQQVFMNLMLNGIEAMKDTGGELTIKSERTKDDKLQISISDTGVGLPGEKVNHIFDAFFTTKPQGTGMGLTITRSIIDAHGGVLWASANTGRGATFQFTLPSEATASSSSAG